MQPSEVVPSGPSVSAPIPAASAPIETPASAVDRRFAELVAKVRELRPNDDLTALEKAYRVASLRYKAGLSRYLDVLTAEDTLVQQRRNVADVQAGSFAQEVALVQALGGGFIFRN